LKAFQTCTATGAGAWHARGKGHQSLRCEGLAQEPETKREMSVVTRDTVRAKDR